MGRWKDFITNLGDIFSDVFKSKPIHQSKEEKESLALKLYPEIRNTSPKLIRKDKPTRRFIPKPRGMKAFLRNPKQDEKAIFK